MPKEIIIPFKPWKQQQEIYEAMCRFTVAVCHRRFGKTVLAVNLLIRGALSCPHNMPRFAYIAPTNKQARDVAFEYLKEFSRVIPGVKANETHAYVQFPNKARITLYGAENADNLRGMYLDGCIMDEVALMKDSVWGSVIRPLLADRLGWCMFIGTPMGKNLFHKLYMQGLDDDYTDWTSFLYTVEDTDILDWDEVQAARKTMSSDEFRQEFMCDFEANIKGAYYASIIKYLEDESRMGGYGWIPEYPVHTAWDIGFKDDTAVWFYQVPPGGMPRIIDYHENRQKGVQYFANYIQSLPYVYGEHWAPHDVKKHEFGSGKTIIEQAANLGLYFNPVKKIPIQDGITYVRSFLPRCYFNTDNKHVADAVEHLRSYRRDYDERLSVFRKKPVHDGASHAADAFRYLAVSYRDDDESIVGRRIPNHLLQDSYRKHNPLRRDREPIEIPTGNVIRTRKLWQ